MPVSTRCSKGLRGRTNNFLLGSFRRYSFQEGPPVLMAEVIVIDKESTVEKKCNIPLFNIHFNLLQERYKTELNCSSKARVCSLTPFYEIKNLKFSGYLDTLSGLSIIRLLVACCFNYIMKFKDASKCQV